MADTFVITGLVREAESGVGLAGLGVRAYDKDQLYDDLMGEAVTACDGGFRIVSAAEDFRDFFDCRPDIYLRLFVPAEDGGAPREVFNTRNAVRWNASQLEYIVVELPRAIACELPAGGHEHTEHGHAETECCHLQHRPQHCSPITKCRDIYLKIEKLPAYSPVAPDDAEHERYRRDCMRNKDHEDTHIPPGEVERRRLDALVYREYLDPNYTVLKTDPLVPADINEPRAERRIPGTVLYAAPGERLFIHVCNGDDQPHSFHVHGLIYGIDSDGSWPFGVQDAQGRRSDAICPGQSWCYVFDVTEETIGAWPFHDHHMHIMETANRGLFGGLVVRDPHCPKPDYEVPLFFHRLTPATGPAVFDSGTLNRNDTFTHTFNEEGTFNYHCLFHPMTGVVRVTATGPLTANISIVEGPVRFEPNDVTIGRGGTVTWLHAGNEPHTVTDTGGAALESFALNGRTFVGNTPTIVARSGKRIRWYVFDLDLSGAWHNFHAHSQRWLVGDERMDTRSLGPAESFVADTIVPPVVLLPLKNDCHSHKQHRADADCGCGQSVGHNRIQQPVKPGGHGGGMTMPGGQGTVGHGASAAPADAPAQLAEHVAHDDSETLPQTKHVRRVRLQGDFLVHCHVEMHMMQGMAAVVRAIQEVELTHELADSFGFELPLATSEMCPDVALHPCAHGGTGSWEQLPDLPIFVVHAALLHTGKVLLWAGTAEVGDPLESRVWDPASGTMTSQTYTVDLFCAGHAFLADGRLCIVGGAPAGSLRATHLFDPAAETWTRVADMNRARWYPTALTLPDGRILAASGSGVSELEIYDPAANTWQLVAGAARTFPELYPSLHLLPTGQVFYSRAGWAQADMGQTQTAYLTLSGAAAGAWTDLGQQQFYERQEGTAVIHLDTTVTPATAQVYIIGGGVSGPPVTRNPLTAEAIELTTLGGGAAWSRMADMNFPRTNVSAVWLPDGKLLVIGGQRNGKWNSDPGAVLEAEIYDPATGTWSPAAPMTYPRQYHSVAVLLPDGRVLTAGGVDPRPATPQRDQRKLEIFSPPYLSLGARPTITTAPATLAYGVGFDIDTPEAAQIASVALLRPASITHHTDAGARYLKLPIRSRTAARLTIDAPANGNLAPPGYYLLFIVDAAGAPSVGRFIRLS